MLLGPIVLIVGSALVLRAASSPSGMVLVGIGCLTFTGFALYNAVTGMQRQPLQAQPPYWLYVALLALMLLSDMAAYKIYRARSVSPNKPPTSTTR
jgi:membrane-bound ClpP family serine protease